MSSKSYNRPMTHQEYLKVKYMSRDDYEPQKVKKKVKKSTMTKAPTVKIIDDDVDFRKLAKHDSDDEELYFGTKEEKPLIEAVIDDRPLHMRTDVPKGKWKVIGGGESDPTDNGSVEDRPTTSQSDEESSRSKAKTLGGKRAGLSSAKEIKKELVKLKRKNDKLIENLTDDISGKNAQTVFRDRKTGKIRSIEKELEEKAVEMEKKALEEAEKKAVYDRWSKGLVQREEQIKRIESDLHEMNKPLARYEDDADRDQYLRQRELDEDPMLMEIRKKKRELEKATNPNYREYPEYKGPPPPPNRFGIKPGYRWDGVDRSNGYEAKIFDKAANREAMQEEAYRWSTQDM